jgi:hypothetical protein
MQAPPAARHPQIEGTPGAQTERPLGAMRSGRPLHPHRRRMRRTRQTLCTPPVEAQR